MRPSVQFMLYRLGFVKPYTSVTENEAAALLRYAEGKETLAEIGVYQGVTTLKLRRVIAPTAVLYAVDPFFTGRAGICWYEQIAKREIRRSSNARVALVYGTGAHAGLQFQQTKIRFDFVFVDGDHSYAGLKGDWAAWSPLIVLGGVIALHDSRSTARRQIDDSGSVLFTKEVILRDQAFKEIDSIETLTVLQKIAGDKKEV